LIVTLGHGELLDYWDDFDVNAVNHKVFCKGKGSVNVVGSGDGEGAPNATADTIIGTLSATDIDTTNDGLTYSINDTNFKITGTQLQL
jgi:hypothetical protein